MGCADGRLLIAGDVAVAVVLSDVCFERGILLHSVWRWLDRHLQMGSSISLHLCESVKDGTLSPALDEWFALRMVKVGRTQGPERGREKESPYFNAS